MNELRGQYDAQMYHVNATRSVLLRLHGTTLRVTHPLRNVLRHGVYDDPSLRTRDPESQSQRIYDLTGAKVVLQSFIMFEFLVKIRLRPRNLAKRRWWTRKYPICIKLRSGAQVTAG